MLLKTLDRDQNNKHSQINQTIIRTLTKQCCFKHNKIKIKNITFINKGTDAQTYKVNTNKGCLALNIRPVMNGDYSTLINKNINHLLKVYEVQKIEQAFYILSELLLPLSIKETKIIDCFVFLFHMDFRDGITTWLKKDINHNLYSEVQRLSNKYSKTPPINFKMNPQFTLQLKWFYKNYHKHKKLILDLQYAFENYKEVFKISYRDFHSQNVMRDKHKQLKLIDL